MTEARARVGVMEGDGSGQVAIWKTELMGLADGLGVEVKGESPWGLSCSDRKANLGSRSYAQLGPVSE